MKYKITTTSSTAVVVLAVLAVIGVVYIAGFSNIDDNFKDDHLFVREDELPDLHSLSLYNEDAPVNGLIDDNAKVDANSDKFIESLLDADGFIISYKQYSTPVYFSDKDTPRYDVALPCGDSWESGVDFLKNVPIPNEAEPAFDSDGMVAPRGCGEISDQDNAMVIVDMENRCEYDFWQARKNDGRWTASWGNAISMDSNGIYNEGFSARGSGFSMLGGMIWPDEFAAGEIKHALIFSYPFTRSGGPVFPASESDGESDEEYAIPEGARLRLDPSLDLTTLGLKPYEMTIAHALQKYGMFLVDNGGDSGAAVYAVDPKSVAKNSYAGILPDEDYISLSNIPLDAFEVLALPQQNSAPLEKFVVEYPQCARFE